MIELRISNYDLDRILWTEGDSAAALDTRNGRYVRIIIDQSGFVRVWNGYGYVFLWVTNQEFKGYEEVQRGQRGQEA